MEWVRRTVRSGGLDLAVFEAGAGSSPTVLMVHGWPDTHHLWTGVAERLVEEGFRVAAYDLRGMGDTPDPGHVDGFALEALATDLVAVADAVSPDHPVHLLAHDWGSVLAWEAVTTPGAERRIASLVSISGPCMDHMGHWLRRSLRRPTLRSIADVAAQVVASAYIWVFISPLGAPLMRRLGTAATWRRILRVMDGLPAVPEHPAATFPDDVVSGLRLYRANVLRLLRRPRDRRTAVPVLQIVPTRDRAIRPACLAESDRWAAHVERQAVPYGHWVPLSAPETVAAAAVAFIRERSTPRAA